MNLVRTARRVLVLLNVALCQLAYSQINQTPVSPLDPTYDDCGALFAQFGALKRPLFDGDLACMRNNAPHFGTCGGCNAGATAWAMCCGFGEQICQLDKAQSSENATCTVRAAARASREAAESESKQRELALEKTMKKGNDLYSSFTQTAENLKDPSKFISDALGLNSSLYSQLVPNDASTAGNDQGTATYEVYRYMWNQANAGIKAQESVGMSPVIGSIQRSSLNMLQKHFDGLIVQMDKTISQIDHFDPSSDYSKNLSIPIIVHQASPAATSNDCSVLTDPSSSSALLNRDQDAWLALTARCKN